MREQQYSAKSEALPKIQQFIEEDDAEKAADMVRGGEWMIVNAGMKDGKTVWVLGR